MANPGAPPPAGNQGTAPGPGEPGGLPPDVEPPDRPPQLEPAPPVAVPPPPRGSRLVRGVARVAQRLTALGLLVTAHTLSFTVLLVSATLIGLLALPYTESGSRWLLRVVPGLQVAGMRGVLFGDFDIDEVSYPIGPRRLVIRHLAWRGLDLSPPGKGQPDWTLSMATLSAAEIDLQGTGDGKPLKLPTELTLPLAIRADHVEIGSVHADMLGAVPIRAVSGAISLGAGSGARHHVDALRLSWDRLDATGRASIGAGAPLQLEAALDLAPRIGTSSAGSITTAPPPLADDWRASVTAVGPLADFELAATARARTQSLDARARVRMEDRLPLAHAQARLSGLDIAAFASSLPTTALTGDILADLGAPTTRPAAAGGSAASTAATATTRPAAPATSTTSAESGAQATAVLPASAASAATASQPITIQADLRNDLPARWDQGGLPVRRLRLEARSDLQAPLRGQVHHLEIDFAGNSTPFAAVAAVAPAAPAPATRAAGAPAATAPGAAREPIVRRTTTRAPAAVAAGSLTGRGSWALVGDKRHLSLQTDATLTDFQTALLDTRAPNLIVSGPLSLGYEHTLGSAGPASAPAATAAAPGASTARPPVANRPAPAAAAATAAAPATQADGPRLTLATDLSGRLSRHPPGGARTRGVAEARRVTLGATTPGAGAGDAANDHRGDWPLVRLRLKAAAQASGIEIEQLDAQSGPARLRATGHMQHRAAAWTLALQATLDDFDPVPWWPGAADTPWQRGPHRLAGVLQSELSLSDQALAASPDTLARLASLSGTTQLRLRSSVLAGVPVAGTLDLHAGAAMLATPAAPAQGQGADRPFDAATGPRVQVNADISVGERALPDSGLSQGGIGMTLRGQLDPLGSDDR
jgi:hypothetical protein